jgi:hypothetical protein
MFSAISTSPPRSTWVVAAAAVLSLVSSGTWGAWQGTGARNNTLASARLTYSLSGDNVTGGGTGYSWGFLLSLLGANDQFSVTNTGTVAETISGTFSVTGVNVGTTTTIYGCTNAFSGLSCSGRVMLGTVPGGNTPTTITLATNLAAGSTYNLAVGVPGLLGLAVTVSMPANTVVITPRTGIDRTAG